MINLCCDIKPVNHKCSNIDTNILGVQLTEKQCKKLMSGKTVIITRNKSKIKVSMDLSLTNH